MAAAASPLPSTRPNLWQASLNVLRCAGLLTGPKAFTAPTLITVGHNAFQGLAQIRGARQEHFTAPAPEGSQGIPPLVVPSQTFAPPLPYFKNPGEEHEYFVPRYLAQTLGTAPPELIASGGFRNVYEYDGYGEMVFKLHRLGSRWTRNADLITVAQEMAMDRGLGAFLGQVMTTATVHQPIESMADLPAGLRAALRQRGLTPERLRERFGIIMQDRVPGEPLMVHIRRHLQREGIDPASVRTINDLRLPVGLLAFFTELRWANNHATTMLTNAGYPKGRALRIRRNDYVAQAIFSYVYGLERLIRDKNELYYIDIAVDLNPQLSNVLATRDSGTGNYELHLVDF